MDAYPTSARRFLIKTMLIRYKKLLEKAKVTYKIPDKKYEELCELFLNPEFVCGTLNKKKEKSDESDESDEYDDSDSD
jgi:hypothetical protein